MIFTLLHEFGHLIAGMLFGFKLDSLLIFPFGFAIKFKKIKIHNKFHNMNRNSIETKKMITAFSGPAVNILFVIFLKLSHWNGSNKEIIIFSNILIAIFNLLPIYPLDGGRILKYLFNILFDRKKTYIYIQNISYIFMFILTFLGSIFMYYLKNIILFFVIIYLWTLVIKEDNVIKMKIKMEKHIQFPEIML